VRFVVLAALLVACKSERGAAPAEEDLISAGERDLLEKEVERGLGICDLYAERVCTCDEESACKLARSIPAALRLHLQALAGGVDPDSGPVSRRDRQVFEAQVRRMIKSCVEKDAALDPKKCPRPLK
jgi:hypothetical protein